MEYERGEDATSRCRREREREVVWGRNVVLWGEDMVCWGLQAFGVVNTCPKSSILVNIEGLEFKIVL